MHKYLVLLTLAFTSTCAPVDPPPIDDTCLVSVERLDLDIENVTTWRVPDTVIHVQLVVYAHWPTRVTCRLSPDEEIPSQFFRRVVLGFDVIETYVDGRGAVIRCDGDEFYVEFLAVEILCRNDEPELP